MSRISFRLIGGSSSWYDCVGVGRFRSSVVEVDCLFLFREMDPSICGDASSEFKFASMTVSIGAVEYMDGSSVKVSLVLELAVSPRESGIRREETKPLALPEFDWTLVGDLEVR